MVIDMEKCRYIALTDINPSRLPWAEKDDIQSLIRLLLYSNEIDLEGVILCSSCFLKRGGGETAVSLVHQILDAYASVKPCLDANSEGYPDPEKLRALVCPGIPAYGKADYPRGGCTGPAARMDWPVGRLQHPGPGNLAGGPKPEPGRAGHISKQDPHPRHLRSGQ